MSIQHRVKRAWLNIVGSAFKTVFGTLDEDDAKQYEEAITKVKKNENRMLDLMKQQIHVVKYNFNNERIIYVISVPIVNTMKYSLYNLIPLPILYSSQSKLVFILPTVKYLALAEIRNTYATLENLGHCKSTKPSELICSDENPIYSAHSRKICEVELLSVTNYIPLSCDKRTLLPAFEIWHKLTLNNSWIYVLPKDTSLTLNCLPKSPINLILSGTGIITLDQGCKLYTSSTTLVSDQLIKQTSFDSIFPKFDILQDCCDETTKRKPNDSLQIIPIQPISLNKDDLDLVSHKLDNLEERPRK
ncbi:hypothetical protein HHI36_013726 [Cryptolaemus montrouzieri]|uniref:Uncharacterized protein n=1 Tax=Cryptolaemus montrouzieri TaxID=559131 RepID=A0ABD2NIB4_9CUCU